MPFLPFHKRLEMCPIKGEDMKTFLIAGVAAVSIAFAGGSAAHADAREDARAISEVLASEEILEATFSTMSGLSLIHI